MNYTSKSEYIDAETGELISPYKVRNGEYVVLKKNRDVSRDPFTNTVTITHLYECVKSRQLKLFND